MRRASSVARLYAPLAVLLLSSIAAGGARTVHAAGTTVIVANTDAPTDCGPHHDAVTDLTAALGATRKGKVLLTAVDFRPLAPAVESVTGTVTGNTLATPA
jgi:hypothetical protein